MDRLRTVGFSDRKVYENFQIKIAFFFCRTNDADYVVACLNIIFTLL